MCEVIALSVTGLPLRKEQREEAQINPAPAPPPPSHSGKQSCPVCGNPGEGGPGVRGPKGASQLLLGPLGLSICQGRDGRQGV